MSERFRLCYFCVILNKNKVGWFSKEKFKMGLSAPPPSRKIWVQIKSSDFFFCTKNNHRNWSLKFLYIITLVLSRYYIVVFCPLETLHSIKLYCDTQEIFKFTFILLSALELFTNHLQTTCKEIIEFLLYRGNPGLGKIFNFQRKLSPWHKK